MSIAVTFNGVSYTIPSPGQAEWAAALNTFLTALATAIGPAGGTITPAATGTGLIINGGATSGRALILAADTTSPVNAALKITPQGAQPSGPNVIGDIYVTSAGLLKICTVAGTPGTWVSVGAQ